VEAINHIRDKIFHYVHSNHLIYNACWEDPRCDRQLLELEEDSEVVMITSAGCNALDYLLDNPCKINCVDVNPRQNALLQLKLATFKSGSYDDLFQLFGKGMHAEAMDLFQDQLRGSLPEFAQNYWDRNIDFFNGRGLRKSFYHYGTSGIFAWLANRYFKSRRSLYEKITELFEAGSLERQTALYYEIEDRLLNAPLEWAVNRHFTMCLIGVPRSQQLLFRRKYEQGALGFIKECLRNVFTQLPASENYFWRLYLQGEYSVDCRPSYLMEQNFEFIRSRTPKVETFTTTISRFLEENPGEYSHYVLLDHQDWLAQNNRPALEEEWKLILANSRPGTRILLRSAADEIEFFPDFVDDKVMFEKEKTFKTHKEDRVGTYASVYLGEVI
jgi:S-adenosylmethionine-diacylglycerol 3-amino-3-carboxypropyl transferase